MRRLYNAVCQLIEAKAQSIATIEEPLPEGAESHTEPSHAPEPFEMHAHYRDDSIDNDYGATIGFTGKGRYGTQ